MAPGRSSATPEATRRGSGFTPINGDGPALLPARNRAHYTCATPDLLDFRYTNEALLSLLFDDDFTHIAMIQASMGFLHGGAIVPKDEGRGYQGLFVAIDAGADLAHLGQGPLYAWAAFDEVADGADPLFQDEAGSDPPCPP